MNLYIIIKGILLTVILYSFMQLMYSKFISKYKILEKLSYTNINERLSNMNFFRKVYFYINKIQGLGKVKIVTPLILVIISVVLSIAIYILSYKLFQINSTAIILGVLSFFIPCIFIEYIFFYQKQKILELFPTYIISLKNYTRVTNDILIAFKKTTTQFPLKQYIDKFNVSVEKGITVFEAIENLKKDIGIRKINDFLYSLQVCYINGGDFTKLLDKFSKFLTETNVQKEKEKQENFSSYMVLVFLIIINVFLLFTFVYSNSEYKQIMTQTFIGKTILNINIISYFVIFKVMKKTNKMEV